MRTASEALRWLFWRGPYILFALRNSVRQAPVAVSGRVPVDPLNRLLIETEQTSLEFFQFVQGRNGRSGLEISFVLLTAQFQRIVQAVEDAVGGQPGPN